MTLEEYKRIIESSPKDKNFTLSEMVEGLVGVGYPKTIKYRLIYTLPQLKSSGILSQPEFWAVIRDFKGTRKSRAEEGPQGTITLTIPESARAIWASVAKKKDTTVQELVQNYLIKKAEGLRLEVERELERVRQEYLEDFCSSVEL